MVCHRFFHLCAQPIAQWAAARSSKRICAEHSLLYGGVLLDNCQALPPKINFLVAVVSSKPCMRYGSQNILQQATLARFPARWNNLAEKD
jgi:hypothetical protein